MQILDKLGIIARERGDFMKSDQSRRLSALGGVVVLIALFILTVVFLFSGNMPMAITMFALNGIVLFIIYFTVRFNKNVEENNPELFDKENDDDENNE